MKYQIDFFEIQEQTEVYRFSDKLINEGWMPPLIGLDDVDNEIRQKYEQFLHNG